VQEENSGALALFNDGERGTVGLDCPVAHGMVPPALANTSLGLFIFWSILGLIGAARPVWNWLQLENLAACGS